MSATASHGWIVPDWPAPAGVQALCTTRQGGCSSAPYDTLNLGSHVGDAAGDVLRNRARLQSHLASLTPGARLFIHSQVHGTTTLALTAQSDPAVVQEADAFCTAVPGAVCTVLVADCLPVLLAHRSGRAVAAAHAGWRGLAGQGGFGVLESALHALAQTLQQPLEVVAPETLAWLGPCIGPTAFEVGDEVAEAFCRHDQASAACFAAGAAPGKHWADLAGLARRRLDRLGVVAVYGNDSSGTWCTVGNPLRFFSHRRDTGRLGGSGRFAACIWRG